MNRDDFGDRMKAYENVERKYLTKRLPAIIRLDMCHGHSYTKGFRRPYDNCFRTAMVQTARSLCANIQGVKCAYTQSDEISLLLVDYDKLETNAWFDKNLQKMVSVSAALATYYFNKECTFLSEGMLADDSFALAHENKVAVFDSRAFTLPKEEVCNYFYWRQLDTRRNAINATAQALFSHKELQSLSCDEILKKMEQEKDVLFYSDFPEWFQNGTLVQKIPEQGWVSDAAPWFDENRNVINQYVYVGE